MFQAGDYIIYGTSGVCLVERIVEMKNPSGAEKKKPYYQLKPLRSQSGVIYTPVQNNKVVMRNVLSKEEALELIDEIPNIEKINITNEKSREDKYKEAIRACDCRQLVGIIKTMSVRNSERSKLGRKVTAMDEKYMHMAKDRLYGELSVAMDKDRDEMEVYITQRMEELGQRANLG